MRRGLLIYMILFCFGVLYAQEETEDIISNKSILSSTASSPKEKSNAFISLITSYTYNELDSAEAYIVKAYNYHDHISKNKLVDDSVSLRFKANILSHEGEVAFVKGDLIKALNCESQARPLWEDLDDKLALGISYNNVAVIHKNAHEYDKAKELYSKALEVIAKTGNRTKMAMCHNNLATLYKHIEEYEKGYEHAKIAVELRLDPYDEIGYARALNNLGSLDVKLERYDAAKKTLLEALVILKDNNNTVGAAYVKIGLAEAYLGLNMIDSAQFYAEEGLSVGEQSDILVVIYQASELLSTIYSKQENWKKAYEMQVLFSESSKKMKVEDLQGDLLKMELQYDYDKQQLINKERYERRLAIANEQDEKQQLLLISTAVIMFSTIIFLIFTFKRNKLLSEQKRKIEEQNNERKTLLQEIHHRVKNNFQVTTSLLKLQADKLQNEKITEAFQVAINRVHAMSSVHEIIYKNESFAKMDHGQYINELAQRLTATFNNSDVEIEVNTTDKMASVALSVPIGIIVNELITNGYKHAFTQEIQSPQIELDLDEHDGLFTLTYKDNGIGFSDNRSEGAFGLELIETMVEQLGGTKTHTSDENWSTIIEVKFRDVD